MQATTFKFTNDISFGIIVKCKDDSDRSQQDTSRLAKWADAWLIKSVKCEVMEEYTIG